jgi:Citrate transporter
MGGFVAASLDMVTHCGFGLRLTLLAFVSRIVTDCHYYQCACSNCNANNVHMPVSGLIHCQLSADRDYGLQLRLHRRRHSDEGWLRYNRAILFFGVVTDTGMLDPIIDRILRTVGTRPTRIVMGTTLLALLIHLDGSGAVTFLITIPAMLPLYDKFGIDRRILACAASMAAGVNFLPWTGPMLRASAALKLPIPEIFNPLLPVQIVGLGFIFGVSYCLGRREEHLLGIA